MAESVGEMVLHPFPRKDGARRRIDIGQRKARPHDGQGLGLGRAHQGERAGKFLARRVSGPEGARLVRAVAVHPAAHIHQHRTLGGNARSTRDGMRQRPVRPGGHDAGKGQPLGAVLAKKAFDLPGQFPLFPAPPVAPREALLHMPQEPVVEREAPLHGRDLFRLLDAPQALHQAVGRLQRGKAPGPRRQLPREGVAHALRLKTRARAATAQQTRQVPGRIAAIQKDALPVPEPGRRVGIPRIRGEPVPAVRRDDEPPRAFVALRVMQLKARQIETVGRAAHEQGIQPARRHEAAQAVAAPRVHLPGPARHIRARSASFPRFHASSSGCWPAPSGNGATPW